MANRVYYSRYQLVTSNGTQQSIPFIKLDAKTTDKKIVWKEGISRMDIISNNYYNDPLYGWIIMLANPQYGGFEFDIPHNSIITIPFPLKETLEEYNQKLADEKQFKLR